LADILFKRQGYYFGIYRLHPEAARGSRAGADTIARELDHPALAALACGCT
jgi:hypothetical protein